MILTIDTLTDKVMEALGTHKGWYLANAVLKEEIPRIVTNEIRIRVEAFIKDFQKTQEQENE